MEAEKVFARALVLGQESVGTQIFSLLLEEKTVAALAKPGQCGWSIVSREKAPESLPL